MKRIALLFALILGIIALTACAPKPEEVNAVVESFWDQWKAGNPAKMADLMTTKVDFGYMVPDDATTSSLAKIANKGVPAMDLAEALISNYPVGEIPGITFSISNTDLFEKYAVVDSIISTEPDDYFNVVFHLRETDDGWKISFIGFKSVF